MAKVIFFGTPDYVIPVLEALKKAGHEIAAVVTQPSKPVGRKLAVAPSPVALWANANDVRVFDQPPAQLAKILQSLGADVGVLEAYGRLIPPEVLTAFPHGIINVHPSLLPRWRGASPVEATIAAGDQETGVTIMKLDQELDHGPILAQFKEPVLPDDTKASLRKRLFDKAAQVLVSLLPAYLEGKIKLREQKHDRATFTTLLKKDHGFIPPEYLAPALQGETLEARWEIPFIRNYSLIPNPYSLERFIRSLDPWPGAWTEIKVISNKEEVIRRLKILKAHLDGGKLVLEKVQLEGKNAVSFKQLQEGYPGLSFAS